MVLAWTIWKDWLMVIAMKMPVDQMGRTLIRDLRSSTCWTLDSFLGLVAVPSGFSSFDGLTMMQALFKNLRERNRANYISCNTVWQWESNSTP